MARRTAFAEYNIEHRWTTLRGSALVGSFVEDGPGPHTTVPHRHDFVELIWLSSGSGTHTIDTSEFPARPRTLHIVAPGQVHFWTPAATPLDGTLVLFREEFLTGPGGLPARVWDGGMAVPDAATGERIDRMLRELEIELAGAASDRDTVVRYQLSALLSVCSRAMVSPAQPRHMLAVAFEHHVHAHLSAALTVTGSARALNVTPNHLTEVVTADTGRPPGAIIRAAVLLEAQRLLTRTTMSCAQVAAALAFDDPSYFSRFFRRETGVTPSVYRTERRLTAA
ncbi:AraC family transcriptional regulator [Microbacterium sp. KR10-403]|uniref:helix-turn-helix domain-containing protein n=1 Tax=Microbacterium sp. KR10-403 TaxID=3158581 RepID=UPI0032E3915B